MEKETKDLFAEVTERIVADLEKGVRPWRQPWSNGRSGDVALPIRANGVRYRGINTVLLWAEAMHKGFASPVWMTFKQAQLQGAHVRRGERGSMIVFSDSFERTETNEAGEETERKVRVLKRYIVFNLEQIEGLPVDAPAPLPAPRTPLERIEAADAFVRATGAVVEHGGNRAFYSPPRDMIQMPPLDDFDDKESYYGTLLHELIHWTRHKTRLDRDLEQKKFGDKGYALEELVAELGAAFGCAELGITPDTREDHASYIQEWLSVLKEDNRVIFRAAAHAQRAADYLKGLQSQPSPPQTGNEAEAVVGKASGDKEQPAAAEKPRRKKSRAAKLPSVGPR
jgi:antirestriction protein ArdC